MAAKKITQAELKRWSAFFDLRDQGVGIEQAANRSRVSPSAAYRFHRGDPSSVGIVAADMLGRSTVAGELVEKPLSEDAREALEDFAKFRLRYFGRKSVQWQVRAAYDILRHIESPSRDYVVINCPPGSGKSTLFTNDIPCWLIARDRTIRIQVGSRTERQARMYVGRIKRSLERDAPMRADADSLAAGVAFDAVACIQDDFGAFRPEGRTDLWRADALVARQLDGVSLDDKEPTVSAWGQDSGFLGGRFDLVIWDDLVDRKNTRTSEAKESLREWWGTEAETRLEPGGVLVLQGQRIAHDDLYRHCLDQKHLDETQKYHHIVYAAHDDDRCQEIHEGPKVKPWPEGCLLDPHRLPYKMLETIKRNSPRVYEVQYQQKDGDAAGGLVLEEWIKGGVDKDGYPAPGCLDTERACGEVPVHLLNGIGYSFVTVDPSPTEWWGIGWWIYEPATGNRYLIDIARRKMNPEDFLSLNLDTFAFSGLIEEWRLRSNNLSAPIQHVIVETNAAQKWLLQQPHIQRWMQATGIVFIPHTTHVNKADPKFGVESIGDVFRQGKNRLPWQGPSTRLRINDLIDELIHYPDHDTTDLVMMTWFGHLAVHNFVPRRVDGMYRQDRPNFVGRQVARGLQWAR